VALGGLFNEQHVQEILIAKLGMASVLVLLIQRNAGIPFFKTPAEE
jgi:hypothetical protein